MSWVGDCLRVGWEVHSTPTGIPGSRCGFIHHDTGATLVARYLRTSHSHPFVGFVCSRGLREGNNSFYFKGCIINKVKIK